MIRRSVTWKCVYFAVALLALVVIAQCGEPAQTITDAGTDVPSTDPCPVGLGPDTPCKSSHVCGWPGTECGTCTCNGHTFQCEQGCCVVGCNEGGPSCPSPDLVIDGQPCTDDAITCPSDHGCDAGASSVCVCASGTWACQCVANPITLASGQPAAVAVDGTHVYWTDFGAGTVDKIDLDGGTPQVIASGQPAPGSLAVDSTSAYWVNTSSTGNVVKVALSGGTPVELASNQNLADAIVVDATNVYWAAYATVMKVPLDGGAPALITTTSQPAFALTVDATNAYWTAPGAISKIALTGGSPMSFAAASEPTGIAVDATNLYWADGPAVIKKALVGGLFTTLNGAAGSPNAIALDASAVYWVDHSGGMVMKVPQAGGATSILAFGQSNPSRIAVDSTNVYWTVTDAVMMTPK